MKNFRFWSVPVCIILLINTFIYAKIDSSTVSAAWLFEGNAKDMYWTFAEIIERASYGVELFPGDVIGSGTVGAGCLLELNGSSKALNPDYKEQWLKAGDEIEMQIEGLGKITNKLIKMDTNHSLLKLKK